MKAHTQTFKDNVCLFGRELDSKITYTLNNEEIELGNEDLNSVSPHYEGGILKSVMKQLDIDSNVDIPLETIVNCQFGVKVNDEYEYIDFGNYIVYKSEKQEDTNSYKITCYDKMLYSMIDYTNMGITYPVTIRNYINAICNYLGITFANINDTFANYDKEIMNELYLDNGNNTLGYTFRDVLDELAQVTASTICINSNDQLEIRYITSTFDTINEEYLKDVNVNFGEKYGPVNSIVFSRSAESDNVYLRDDESVETNGLCEIKIIDNQILNFNDRSDYLQDILNRLDGLEYYLNDFSSTGITYYDLCDRYNVSIGNQTYSCVMFNDEINITQGLEEIVHTDMPEETVTDYTKADKTDRKINQTYLIVDKQNQAIEAISSQVDEQNDQIASIRLQYDEISAKISDIADITTSGESSYANVNLIEVNASDPIDIKIRPINESICYLYPRSNLYPSSSLYPKNRILRFTNTETSEVFEWVLPTDLWYYDSTTYDELELSYGDGTNSTVTVIRRCSIDSNGVISVLATPTSETYVFPTTLHLTDGDYTITLLGYQNAYLYVQLMAANIYTTQFATRVEMNSAINQTAQSINLEVSRKVNSNEVISAINLSPESITINSNKLNLVGYVTLTNLSTAGQTTINGANITTGTLDASQVTVTNLNAANITAGIISVDRIPNLSADKITTGTLNASNVTITNINASNITGGTMTAGNISLNGGTVKLRDNGHVEFTNGTGFFTMGPSYGGATSTIHPYVSSLNVAGLENAISFRSSTNIGSTGSQLAAIGIVDSAYLKITPGSRFYIDSHYGLTGQMSVVGMSSSGSYEYYVAYWKGILAGVSRSPFSTSTYPWLV